MRLIMMLWQLLKHSKNINWYCFFKEGKCYIALLPEKWMDYFYFYYSLEQYEKQKNIFQAIKYFMVYNGGNKNEKKKF